MYWLKKKIFFALENPLKYFTLYFSHLIAIWCNFFSKRHLLKFGNGNVKPSLKVNTQLLREKKYAKYHTYLLHFISHYSTFWGDAFITKPISWQQKTNSSRINKRTMKSKKPNVPWEICSVLCYPSTKKNHL